MWQLVAIGAAGVLLVLFIIVKLVKRRNKKKEMQRSAEDKLREEALDKVLIEGRRLKEGKQAANVPFDVKYDADQRKKGKQSESRKSTEIMIQLTERCELSTRKYMFHIVDRITIGSQTGVNDVVAVSPKISKRQCELFRIGHDLFVKNIGTGGRVKLIRGKKQLTVGTEGVQLRSEDELLVGDYAYEIVFL